jgi:hypothetical protein
MLDEVYWPAHKMTYAGSDSRSNVVLNLQTSFRTYKENMTNWQKMPFQNCFEILGNFGNSLFVI